MNILFDQKVDEVIPFRKLPNSYQYSSWTPGAKPSLKVVIYGWPRRQVSDPNRHQGPFTGQRSCNSQAIEWKWFPLWGSWAGLKVTKSCDWVSWVVSETMLMVSGWQGQTPYGLIVFGEGEMINTVREASQANISGHMGTQYQDFTKPHQHFWKSDPKGKLSS